MSPSPCVATQGLLGFPLRGFGGPLFLFTVDVNLGSSSVYLCVDDRRHSFNNRPSTERRRSPIMHEAPR